MNSTSPCNPTKHESLHQALEEIGFSNASFGTTLSLLELGPGAAYLLVGKEKRLRYLSTKNNHSLPISLLAQLQAANSFEEHVHPDDLDNYLTKSDESDQSPNEVVFEYRLAADNNWLHVQDFRIALKNAEDETVGYLGRLCENSSRIQSLESGRNKAWKDLSNSSIRRFLHDFNNTIAGIYSLSELYAQEGSEMSSLLEGMAHIRDNSLRAQKITQRIREISTMSKGPKTYCNFEKIIEEQQELILSLLPKGTDITLDLSGQSMPVYSDPTSFIQTFLHIIANAAEAACKNPTVTIRSQASQISRNGQSTPAICIEIIDNGTGIEARNLNRARDAFFTTKDPEKHAGMGLYIVNQYLKEQNGLLEIESSTEGETTIRLQIPTADLRTTLGKSDSANESATPTNEARSNDSKQKTYSVLIYTWEDIAHSPLLQLMRDQGWKYRIHIDPLQVKLDMRDLSDSLDGIVVCHSALDEHAKPLLDELGQSEYATRTAVISMDGSIETLPTSIQGKFNYESSNEIKPATQLKRLAKFFS